MKMKPRKLAILAVLLGVIFMGGKFVPNLSAGQFSCWASNPAGNGPCGNTPLPGDTDYCQTNNAGGTRLGVADETRGQNKNNGDWCGKYHVAQTPCGYNVCFADPNCPNKPTPTPPNSGG